MPLNGKERILAALNHKEPDRLPIDFGGTLATSIHAWAYEKLKDYLGFSAPTIILRKRALLAKVDPELMDRFQVDTRFCAPANFDGWDDKAQLEDTIKDKWGITWYRPPSADAYYTKNAPLAEIEDEEALRRYPWPDPHDLTGDIETLEKEIEALRESDKAVILNLACQFLTQSRFMRGYENFLMDLILNPGLAASIMDHILEIQMAMAEEVLAFCGNKADVIYIADDLAMQTGPLFSPEIYRQLIKPRQKRLIESLKKHSPAKILYHSCGAVRPLIPDLIEIGIDALNPVQVSAKGMDSLELKKEFGRDLTFWGGIDTQHVLPFVTAEGVKEEVKKRIADFAPGGGFVLAATHDIRPEVPPQNIIAMLESALEYGSYQ